MKKPLKSNLKICFAFLPIFYFGCTNNKSTPQTLFEKNFDTPSDTEKKAVIVFSLDGVGMEQLLKIDPKFVEDYSVTALTPDEVSLTFPGHASLVTGVDSSLHKVTQNPPSATDIPFAEYNKETIDKYIGHANRMKVPPIWLFAREKGFEVDIYHWAMALNKWCGQTIRDNRDIPFDKEAVTVDKTVNAVFSKLISWDRKKDLLMYAYSTGLDTIGHQEGAYSEKTRQTWRKYKTSIESLISSVRAATQKSGINISLYFVSDHGMYDKFAEQAVDLKGLLNYVEIDPEQNILTKLRRLWMIRDHQYTDTQLEEIGKYFFAIAGPQTTFRISLGAEENNTPFVLDFERASCESKDPNLEFLGTECHVHDGGHHKRAGTTKPVELDGIYFSINPISNRSTIPTNQKEFVPILAKDLQIDMSKQMQYESCEIENLESLSSE